MSIDRYFIEFPIIKYGNTQVVDITKRVTFLESVSKNPYIYYPYEITDNERAEQFSNRYYEDPYKSWIVYLSNEIIDPYYEWYMSQNEFNEYLIKKYGSVENAMNKVMSYKNNWLNSENIDINGYDALSAKLKDYWEPVYGNMNKIVSYKRKKIDWTVNTNRIVSYTVSNSSFSNNEICNIHFDNYNSGKGQILNISNNTVYIQHTTGATVSNSTILITSNSYIYGTESNVNSSFSTSTLMVSNLSPEEEHYWNPIYYYDYENERNEFNKTLRIIDNMYSYDIVKSFKSLIK